MHVNGRNVNGAGHQAIGRGNGDPLNDALAQLAAFVAREVSQPTFAFVEGDPVPSTLALLHNFVRVVSEISERESIARDVITTVRDSARHMSSSGALSCEHQAVLTRLAGVEDALAHLEPILKENAQLRQRDFQFGVLGPFACDVIDTIDGLEKDLALVVSTGEHGRTSRETKICSEVARLITIRRDELLSVLSRRGIEAFASPVHAKFEPSRHRGISSRAARRAADRGLIAKHLRPGYWRAADGWVVRPQWVEVFRDDTEFSTTGKDMQ